jgi:hypothetical protein
LKTLAAIGIAGLIAATGALWFSTNSNVAVVKIRPMKPNPDLPTFKRVQERVLKQQTVDEDTFLVILIAE